MKKLIYLIVFLSLNSFSQDKYLTKDGHITFEASMPSFEEVKGTSTTVTAILNATNAEFAALALVKGFRFKIALMEEHFNENYAESDKFPKATFKGKIDSFDIYNLNANQKYNVSGQLSFHGEIKQFKNLPILISMENEIITMKGTFNVKASDFDIKIPAIVREKLAEDILISFEFNLDKK
ncbi:YceI family protein [Maribacter sp. IgM3_T14_3]|uniref:YceI family protein n=1 Tax=Maribacter sp. IgM3_T14_3 TaxID=3415140 RepID=UPI003C6EC009